MQVKKRTKKNAGKRAYTCAACNQVIKPGQKYYTWVFRYAGARYQHVKCGYPRRSQLTQSHMADVYDAIDTAEQEIADATDPADMITALESAGEVVQDVQSRYAEAAESFGGGGPNAERADELEGFADELTSFSLDDVEPTDEDWEGDDSKADDETEDEYKQRAEDASEAFLDRCRDEAKDVLANCPL